MIVFFFLRILITFKDHSRGVVNTQVFPFFSKFQRLPQIFWSYFVVFQAVTNCLMKIIVLERRHLWFGGGVHWAVCYGKRTVSAGAGWNLQCMPNRFLMGRLYQVTLLSETVFTHFRVFQSSRDALCSFRAHSASA